MRRSTAKKRIILPDPKYNDTMVTIFVNHLMHGGKKSIAFSIFYNAIDIVSEKTKEDGLAIWKQALDNVMPSVEVKSRRVGGATFQIPQEVRPNRKVALGMKWQIRYARERNAHSMQEKLAEEIIAGSKGEGGAFKKKEDTRKMAEANRAFSHFRF
ncbi:MAG: 30S ribosomal protein S7 [Flavobacteriales bacterium]|nr:30S ribosomal protein S7 [Flavobacteriales bacterium]MBL4734863.1 30S ribosomal protein S7 [Flavobacteriales bacterium]